MASSPNLFCGQEVDNLQLPLKKFLKCDYLVYYNETDPNFSETDVAKLSKGAISIKLKSKGKRLTPIISKAEILSKFSVSKKKRKII